ncbi:MAG: tetratricopeptide repeat protein, partial [Fimbriimonadaceae bacterium]|nr:tetratricopeptide repeat protein [Alphaproteobacteria bacterium]
MSDVFREVDEDLRHEQMTKMWKQFGPYVIGAAVLVVAVVAGYKGWNWYTANQAANAGLKFEEAMTEGLEGARAEAIVGFEALSTDAPGEYPVLALLAAAGMKARNGETAGAIAEYDAIAAMRGADPEIADLARIQAGMLLLDTAERAVIVDRMSGIASGGGAWRHAALEIMGLAAWKAGAINDAAALFRQVIADVQAPRGVRQRSQVMLALITPDETAARENAPQT